MTRPADYNAIEDVVKLLADDGFDALGEAIRRVINEAMRLERQHHLGVGPTSAAMPVAAMLTGISQRPFRLELALLTLMFPKFGIAAFIPLAWRRDYVRSGP